MVRATSPSGVAAALAMPKVAACGRTRIAWAGSTLRPEAEIAT